MPAASKKFKKKKLRSAAVPQAREELVTFSWERQLVGSVRANFFPGLKIILPTLSLFVLSVLLLLMGPVSLRRLDSALAFSDAGRTSAMLPAVVGIQKQPEVRINSRGIAPPALSAWSAEAVDVASGEVLYEKDIHSRRAPASTTKLMTALVGSDYFKNGDQLVVDKDDLVGGSTMGLKLGEGISFRSLLFGLLLPSGNDAAFAIASNYPGGVAAFVKEMNERALSLGLTDTHFTNPAGFDSPDHYSSASDLIEVAKAVALNNQLSKIVATKEAVVLSLDKQPGASASASTPHKLKNLNQLLGEPGILGMKTGTTEMAGESLVTLTERDGHKVIIVMLGSRDRFNETRALINWIYSNYSWIR